jgi:hypothetical protein
MPHPYRCNRKACRARTTLRKHAEEYVNRPVCPSCGGGLHCDRWLRASDKKRTCFCSGVAYPHNQHHTGCYHYKGSRDLQAEAEGEMLARGLGATTEIQHDDDNDVPF